MSHQQLVKDAIDSMCLPCARRILYFQMFTFKSDSPNYWITEHLNAKKAKEKNQPPTGCGICFGLLEKYSQTEFLTELAAKINGSGIEFQDFRISLTQPNLSTVREKFIQLTLESIPLEEISIKMYNQNCLTVKEDWKILTFTPLEKIVTKPYNHHGPFDVMTKFTLDDALIEADNRLLDTKKDPYNEPKRLSRKTRIQKEVQEKGFTKTNVDLLLSQTNLEKMKSFYQLPFQRLTMELEVDFQHDPIYLAGRYLKYSRTLSQSKWLLENETFKINSIEEVLSAVLVKELGATESVFAASGREDIDVKCLGTGRPFFVEFIAPKRTKFSQAEMNRYQTLINSSTNEMEVRDLQYVEKQQTKLIREGQNDKTKCYTALCYCYSRLNQEDIDKLNSLTEVEVFQKTPIRVLHRRTVMTRSRVVSEINASLIDEHHFKIKMKTQAGAYVKEFVHGDLGRTEPSICTILNKECDILELDVEAVNLDFPPPINYDDETCQDKEN